VGETAHTAQLRFGDPIRHVFGCVVQQKASNPCGLVACAIGPHNINECLQPAPILKRSARSFAKKAESGG
jgi:hypothetical protein